MKKNLLLTLAVVVAMSLTAYNAFHNQEETELSAITLENVEALASSEINPDCPDGCLTTPGYCFCYRPYPNKTASWR